MFTKKILASSCILSCVGSLVACADAGSKLEKVGNMEIKQLCEDIYNGRVHGTKEAIYGELVRRFPIKNSSEVDFSIWECCEPFSERPLIDCIPLFGKHTVLSRVFVKNVFFPAVDKWLFERARFDFKDAKSSKKYRTFGNLLDMTVNYIDVMDKSKKIVGEVFSVCRYNPFGYNSESTLECFDNVHKRKNEVRKQCEDCVPSSSDVSEMRKIEYGLMIDQYSDGRQSIFLNFDKDSIALRYYPALNHFQEQKKDISRVEYEEFEDYLKNTSWFVEHNLNEALDKAENILRSKK